MGSIRSFRDLEVWQFAMDLAEATYRLVRMFPRWDALALGVQMTRAAASVPGNVAEGHGSHSRKVYAQRVSSARGSLMELQTYLLLAVRVGHISEADARPALDLSERISRMLASLLARLRERPGADRT